MTPRTPSITVLVLFSFLLVGEGQAGPLAPASRQAAERAAESLVVLEYVLSKESSGFAASGQRSELSALGLIVAPDGLVLLSDNVFPEDADDYRSPALPGEFRARLADGTSLDASLVGRDEDLGLAFLRLDHEGTRVFPHLEFSPGAAPSSWDGVILVGLMPERYGHAPSFVHTSIVAEFDTPRPAFALEALVQDPAIGAPVLDADGRALGVIAIDRFDGAGPGALPLPLNVLSTITRGKAAGFPLLLPADSFRALLTDPPGLVAPSVKPRAWLGVTLQAVDEKLANYLGIVGPSGVLVTSVWQGSPAQRAGLRPEDVILKLDGKDVDCPDDEGISRFIEDVQDVELGRSVGLSILRKSRKKSLTVSLEQAPKTSIAAAEYRAKSVGLVAQDLTMDIIQSRAWPADTKGAIVSDMETAGRAQVAGLQRGDVILAVGQQAVTGVADLEAALNAAEKENPDEIVLFVLRDPDTLFVVIAP